MFRRILLASAAAVALTGAALTAEPAPPPPAAPSAPLWTGFYAGLNAGGAWLNNAGTNVSTINVFDDKHLHPDGEGSGSAISQTGAAQIRNAGGIIGGGQIGYSYQFAPSWLGGVETDIQGLGVRGNGAFTRLGFETEDKDGFPDEGVLATVRTENTVDWLGTVRGRLGWLATPTFLVFGGGGFAYGGVGSNTNVQSLWTFEESSIVNFEQWVPGYGGVSRTRPGWTAGGGAEWMFLPDWSLKVEYLYYSLGSVQYGLNTQSIIFQVDRLETLNHSFISARFSGSIVRAGINYHFNWLPAPAVAKS